MPSSSALPSAALASDVLRPQVAEQQGRYLAACLNKQAKEPPGWQPPEGFVYRSLGSMASVGGQRAVLSFDSGTKHLNLAGWVSWVAWRRCVRRQGQGAGCWRLLAGCWRVAATRLPSALLLPAVPTSRASDPSPSASRCGTFRGRVTGRDATMGDGGWVRQRI
jgi:hypothetical protein